jgi:hypothetical protein
MNERIKELALQANGPNPFYGTLKNQMTLLGDDAVKKFAELIVRECIGCCDEVGRINQYHIEKDFIDPELGPKECIEVIKKHFGVEE